MARDSGQWGGEQHAAYMKALEEELAKVEPVEPQGCGKTLLTALLVILAAFLVAYGFVRGMGWPL